VAWCAGRRASDARWVTTTGEAGLAAGRAPSMGGLVPPGRALPRRRPRCRRFDKPPARPHRAVARRRRSARPRVARRRRYSRSRARLPPPPPPPPPPGGDPGAHRRAVAAPPRASYDAHRRRSVPTGGVAAPPLPPWGDATRHAGRGRCASTPSGARGRALSLFSFLFGEASSRDPIAFSTLRLPRSTKLMALVSLMVTLLVS